MSLMSESLSLLDKKLEGSNNVRSMVVSASSQSIESPLENKIHDDNNPEPENDGDTSYGYDWLLCHETLPPLADSTWMNFREHYLPCDDENGVDHHEKDAKEGDDMSRIENGVSIIPPPETNMLEGKKFRKESTTTVSSGNKKPKNVKNTRKLKKSSSVESQYTILPVPFPGLTSKSKRAKLRTDQTPDDNNNNNSKQKQVNEKSVASTRTRFAVEPVFSSPLKGRATGRKTIRDNDLDATPIIANKKQERRKAVQESELNSSVDALEEETVKPSHRTVLSVEEATMWPLSYDWTSTLGLGVTVGTPAWNHFLREQFHDHTRIPLVERTVPQVMPGDVYHAMESLHLYTISPPKDSALEEACRYISTNRRDATTGVLKNDTLFDEESNNPGIEPDEGADGIDTKRAGSNNRFEDCDSLFMERFVRLYQDLSQEDLMLLHQQRRNQVDDDTEYDDDSSPYASMNAGEIQQLMGDLELRAGELAQQQRRTLRTHEQLTIGESSSDHEHKDCDGSHAAWEVIADKDDDSDDGVFWRSDFDFMLAERGAAVGFLMPHDKY